MRGTPPVKADNQACFIIPTRLFHQPSTTVLRRDNTRAFHGKSPAKHRKQILQPLYHSRMRDNRKGPAPIKEPSHIYRVTLQYHQQQESKSTTIDMTFLHPQAATVEQKLLRSQLPTGTHEVEPLSGVYKHSDKHAPRNTKGRNVRSKF